jgi:5'(3')-deoxyribonucleotidase
MRVGVDLDGVCFDFEDSLKRYLKDHRPHLRIPHGQVQVWEFYTEWGLDLKEFIQACHDGVDLGYVFRGPVRRGAPAAIRRIKDAGHSIHIVTDRQFGSKPENSHQATREWLAEHEIPYDTLTFSADKTVIPTDMFVDDKLENYDALDAVGTEVWLVSRPWNRADDDRRRVRSIREFASKVDRRARQGIY